MSNKPIKRTKEIQPLSREHHDALLFVWKIRKGLKQEIELERMNNFLDWFWHNHLAPHFKDEEDLLFTDLNNSLVRKALNEHSTIQKMFANSKENISAEYLEELSNLMETHVRFEERILFPELESKMSEEELFRIGKILNEKEDLENKQEYQDQFWL